MSQPHLVIIDGYSFFFRAFHAVRGGLTRSSDGLPTNALYGFSQMLLKVMKDLTPDLCCVALDSGTPTFRHELFPAYKANRAELEPAMIAQLPHLEPLVQAFGIATLKIPGVEADDIIATLCATATTPRITIVSSDKDLMQLLDETGRITMLDTLKNKRIGPDDVREKFTVGPERVVDVQALIGDSSDNIPGVPSIGPKTAGELINEFGSFAALYANIAQVKREKIREKLAQFREQALLSYQLVTLQRDVPLPQVDLTFRPDFPHARAKLLELEFTSLAARLGPVHSSATPTEPTDSLNVTEQMPITRAVAPPIRFVRAGVTVAKASQPSLATMGNLNFTPTQFECVTTQAQLECWLQRCKAAKMCAFDTETTSLDAMQAKLVGVSLAVIANTESQPEIQACYIPLAHQPREGDLMSNMQGETMQQLPMVATLAQLQEILTDASVLKIAHNLKYDLLVLWQHGLDVVHTADTMLLSAALAAGRHGHSLDFLAEHHFGYAMTKFTDVAGSGQKQVTFDYIPLSQATHYAAEDAAMTLKLYQFLHPQLNPEQTPGPLRIYNEIELPLLRVLTQMEQRGVMVDRAQLGQLSQELAVTITRAEQRIHTLAGRPFNVASPKQLGDVLFDHLRLTVQGKTPPKRSTNVAVLEELAAAGHDIAREVLNFRSASKLRSTYAEALVQQINPKTGRVHTSYNPVGAATGRFSSSDPNLQNIPIRTEMGRKIRQAFIAAPGHVLLGADYSQIELRLLAHFSRSEALTLAFNEGRDIHAFTASKVFGVALDAVQPDQRRVAKILNFGLIYGMGAMSVAAQLGIPRAEAQDYVNRFFARYDGVKDYMEANKQFARDHGYVETLYGRRIHLPEIHASNGGLRAGAERAAINAPLQGSNADIIKQVMPVLANKLDGFGTKMLLQVHDELVFEVPTAELEAVQPIIRETMETITTLRVPLQVGMAYGANWEEAH